MFRVWLLYLSCLGLFLHSASFVSATTLWSKVDQPARIISLAPNITEALFAVGAGHRVVGVSDHCDYPNQATQLPKVGGMRPQLESIVALKPDLVILGTPQLTVQQHLQQLGIQTLMIQSRTLADIRTMMLQIGQATGHQQQATRILATLDNDIAVIRVKTQGKARPKVLISLAHHLNNGAINTLYIAGQQDFYRDLLWHAGGENVYQQSYPKVPTVTLEGLLTLNPDVIIDIFPDADDHPASLAQIRKQWLQLTSINAIQHQQLYLLEADYATIPGPRVHLLLRQFAQFLHPELDWSEFAQP